MLYDEIDYKLTWVAMEKLVEKGLVRAIGLSNFNSRQIDDVLSIASIKPTVLQVKTELPRRPVLTPLNYLLPAIFSAIPRFPVLTSCLPEMTTVFVCVCVCVCVRV